MQTSIFTDDTGRRTSRARWGVRIITGALLLGVAALTLSLVTHVSLPGLALPDTLRGDSDSAVEAPRETPSTTRPTPTTTAPSTRTPVSPVAATTPRGSAQTQPRQTGNASGGKATTPTTPAPVVPSEASPTTSPGKSGDAPRARPTHAPGTPPVTPPGKAK